jgi:hypothetical protein
MRCYVIHTDSPEEMQHFLRLMAAHITAAEPVTEVAA